MYWRGEEANSKCCCSLGCLPQDLLLSLIYRSLAPFSTQPLQLAEPECWFLLVVQFFFLVFALLVVVVLQDVTCIFYGRRDDTMMGRVWSFLFSIMLLVGPEVLCLLIWLFEITKRCLRKLWILWKWHWDVMCSKKWRHELYLLFNTLLAWFERAREFQQKFFAWRWSVLNCVDEIVLQDMNR